jgi:hypothetical protein
MIISALISFLIEHKLLVLTAHILGTILGLGGASIADLLFFRFLKDYKITAKECDVLHLLKSVILGALGLIIVSGIGLYLTDMARYGASGPFMAKMLIVGIITINGIALHVIIAPHFLRLDLKRYHVRYQHWRRLAFALGGISVCSWYCAFFIAMLKTILPQDFTLLFGGYLALLSLTLITTQVMERRLIAMARA